MLDFAGNQKEILTMRLIDRPLRPLFTKGLRDEVVIQCWVESADGQNDPDVLAGTAAAAALAISSLPFEGPVATVRVAHIDGQFAINPTVAQLEYSDLELVLSGHRDGVNMIEVGAQQVSEEVALNSIKFGHEQHRCSFGLNQQEKRSLQRFEPCARQIEYAFKRGNDESGHSLARPALAGLDHSDRLFDRHHRRRRLVV